VCDDALAARAIRYAGDVDLLHRRVLIERRFHLKRRDQLPALPDHFRLAVEKPVIIVIVEARQVAGEDQPSLIFSRVRSASSSSRRSCFRRGR
jgi:hypothetical protein